MKRGRLLGLLTVIGVMILSSGALASGPAEAGQEISAVVALERAKQYHPLVVAATRSLASAQRSLARAEGVYAPDVALSARPEYVVDDDAALALSFGVKGEVGLPSGLSAEASVTGLWEQDEDSLAWDYKLSAAYPLLRDPALSSSVRAAAAAQFQVNTAKQELERAEAAAQIDITERLYQLHAAQKRMNWAAQELDAAREQESRRQEQYGLGAIDEIEWVNAQIAARRAEIDAEQAVQAYRAQLSSLVERLGLDAEGVYRFSPPDGFPAYELDQERSFYQEQALRTSPAVLSAARSLERAEEELAVAQQAIGPSLRLRGSYDRDEWSLWMELSQSLTEWKRSEPVIEEREAALVEAQERLDAVKADVEAGIADLWSRLADAEQELDIARLVYRRNLLTVEQEEEQLGRGLLAPADVRASYRALEEAELRMKELELRWQVTVMELQLVAGIPLQL